MVFAVFDEEVKGKDSDFDSNIKMELIDNGVRIPDIMKKIIFQLVFKKTKEFKRIGLGLLLVNVIIRSIFAKIWVEDKVQGDYTKSNKFVIIIPKVYRILEIER
ncbi:MAG: hypothetical protein ACFFDN_05120 [Candidatus Hodarchaeota archaeon]